MFVRSCGVHDSTRDTRSGDVCASDRRAVLITHQDRGMGDDDLCRDPFTAVSGVDGLDGVPQHPLSGLHRVLRARGWWYYDDGTGAADPFLAWLPAQPLWAYLPSLDDADEVPAFIDVFPATVWVRDDHVQLHFAGPHGRPCGLHRPPAGTEGGGAGDQRGRGAGLHGEHERLPPWHPAGLRTPTADAGLTGPTG